MRRKIALVILLAMLISAVLAFFSYAEESDFLYDGANIMSDADKARIEEELRSFNEDFYSELHVVTYSGGTSRAAVDRYLNMRGYHYDPDIVIFVVELYPYDGIYYYELFTLGNTYNHYSNKEVNLILDNEDVYNATKSGRFSDAVGALTPLVMRAGEGKLRRDGWVWRTALVSLIIATVISGGATGIIIYKYKKKLKSPIYPLERYARLELNTVASTDIFLGKTVTSVRIRSSSGSSRSGGGGGFSGGSRGRR